MTDIRRTAISLLRTAASLPSRLLVLLCLCMVSMHAGAADTSNDILKIGSKRFTESYILAEILAQTAAPSLSTPPLLRQGLGNTAITYEALHSGAIDMYAEYTGTISLEILKNPQPMSIEQMRAPLAKLGLGIGIPFGFNDGYALAMRDSTAARLNIHSLSDLARHPELRLGLSNEFIGRADGWRGLAERYHFTQQPIGLDHGLAYEALSKGKIDVTDIYTTDAQIQRLGLRVLTDDLGYFPLYDAVVLYRLDVPQRFPQAWAALQRLTGSINEPAMIAMNASAEINGQTFEAIAKAHLHAPQTTATRAGTPATSAVRGFADKLFGPDLGRLTLQHLALVAISVLAAIAIAVPAGTLIAGLPRCRAVVLGVAGLLQTIPSLALLAVLISLLGTIGAVPALIALTLYALLPIMRNTSTGLAEVPEGLRLAAAALGMTRHQRRYLIELPLAAPSIIAGIRTATSISIGTATLAAFIGAGGYGERIVTGLALNDRGLLLAGALPAAALAIVSEIVFEGIEVLLMRRAGRITQARQ